MPRSVPITKGGDSKVVYSVRVDGLASAERLAVSGEVTLSLCEPSEGAPCKRDTPFTPKVTARIVLGSSETDASGPALTRASSLDCSRRDHHCTLSIGEEVTKGFAGTKFAQHGAEVQNEATAGAAMALWLCGGDAMRGAATRYLDSLVRRAPSLQATADARPPNCGWLVCCRFRRPPFEGEATKRRRTFATPPRSEP